MRMAYTTCTPRPGRPTSVPGLGHKRGYYAITHLKVRVDGATQVPPEVDVTWLLCRFFSFFPPMAYHEQCQLSPTALRN